MNEAIILHTVIDAEHCVKNNLYTGRLLFSTHSGVDVYLKELYGIDCKCLSSFLSIKDVIHHKKLSSAMVEKVLNSLDTHIAPSINAQFNLNMRYFVPLYSYRLKHFIHGCSCFVHGMNTIIRTYHLQKIFFYEEPTNHLIDEPINLRQFVSLFWQNTKTEFIQDSESEPCICGWTERINTLKTISYDVWFRKFFTLLKTIRFNLRLRKITTGRKTILVSGLQYDLSFLMDKLDSYNILLYTEDSSFPRWANYKKTPVDVHLNFQGFHFIDEKDDPFVNILLTIVSSNFSKNIGIYINAINHLKKINRQFPISLGLWGSPPVHKTASLVYEYLRLKKIKILGAQHGCNYGDSFHPWHFDSDFNRCDYYLSYGFTTNDLERLYPEIPLKTEILPLGAAKILHKKKPNKKTDILFPITNSTSMFDGGMVRLPPDRLTERQVKILTYLDSLRHLEVLIKPFPNANFHNCSVLPFLKKLNHLTIIKNLSFQHCLEEYAPSIILIEFPSQPLFEALETDAEIFLLSDPLMPHEADARKKLEKRVHYSDTTDDFISNLRSFLEGPLEKKQDSSFCDHYLRKRNTRRNILQTIHKLVNRGNLN